MAMNQDLRTARVTGLWYLGLAVTGLVGFVLLRPQVYEESDPATTLRNLAESEGLARLVVVVELGIVATQALAAVWFYKLLRPLNRVAAWSVAAFGVVNAVMILTSAGFMATAVTVASDTGLAPGGDPGATVQLLFELSASMWAVGGLFFGLWLIPMGYVAATSGRMSRPLGWVLMAGGIGYVLSTFADVGLKDSPGALVDALTIPATVGEFWMIGFLLFVGLRAAPPASRVELRGE